RGIHPQPGRARHTASRAATDHHHRAAGRIRRSPPGHPRAGRTGAAVTRHFLADDDLDAQEQESILDLAARLKAERHLIQPLAGPQAVAIIFDKPTLRTQLSFTTGVAELGGYPMVVDGNLAQIGTRESVADVARVVGRQVGAIVWRTHGQERIEEMAAHVDVPVVNALTDDYHPCQLLADLLTVREHLGGTRGRSLTY